jgi:hypothetical protein
MNRLTAAIALGPFAAVLFVSGVTADDIYQGFAAGNPDLRAESNDYVGSGVIQRGVGDSIDRYQGWADGNGDLFRRFDAPVDDHEPPNVYEGFRGNPDL